MLTAHGHRRGGSRLDASAAGVTTAVRTVARHARAIRANAQLDPRQTLAGVQRSAASRSLGCAQVRREEPQPRDQPPHAPGLPACSFRRRDVALPASPSLLHYRDSHSKTYNSRSVSTASLAHRSRIACHVARSRLVCSRKYGSAARDQAHVSDVRRNVDGPVQQCHESLDVPPPRAERMSRDKARSISLQMPRTLGLPPLSRRYRQEERKVAHRFERANRFNHAIVHQVRRSASAKLITTACCRPWCATGRSSTGLQRGPRRTQQSRTKFSSTARSQHPSATPGSSRTASTSRLSRSGRAARYGRIRPAHRRSSLSHRRRSLSYRRSSLSHR